MVGGNFLSFWQLASSWCLFLHSYSPATPSLYSSFRAMMDRNLYLHVHLRCHHHTPSCSRQPESYFYYLHICLVTGLYHNNTQIHRVFSHSSPPPFLPSHHFSWNCSWASHGPPPLQASPTFLHQSTVFTRNSSTAPHRNGALCPSWCGSVKIASLVKERGVPPT